MSGPRDHVSLERAREVLDYDPVTGIFRWKAGSGSANKLAIAGEIAGRVSYHEYIKITIDGRATMAHRLVWLMTYGRYPELLVDHINGQKSDNRLCNLREADKTQNVANEPPIARNRLGVRGVYQRKNGKFYAYIRKNGKPSYLGTFKTVEEAHQAYCVAAKEIFGEFTRVGT